MYFNKKNNFLSIIPMEYIFAYIFKYCCKYCMAFTAMQFSIDN